MKLWMVFEVMAVVAAAGFIQGLTSFGFSLVSMPLLSLWLPVTQAVPLVVILSLLTNLVILAQAYKKVRLGRIWALLAASLAAAPLGAYLLTAVPASALKGAAGLLILGYTLLLLNGRSFKVRNERLAFVPVGLVSGLLNGSLSMSGPPVALFLSGQGMDRDAFRANLTAYACMLNIITLAAFGREGLVDASLLRLLLQLTPALLIGVWVGTAAVRRLDEKAFKKVTLWLLVVSSLWSIAGALGAVR
ncbi:sulfite exporter TauE/SafE family protein [Paenibacillus spiritus]|uniref:Probable membrane transporter protein n=1 Tax=Paenibacillus spiritus TaxID=2496557 RepID=A0A5J5FUH3_9BACL|nr:sulfite exporter TauE/SafE family protein [Paenibacillus spiritus]KAA8997179.1 sulfite exporter TauE/SafE family protein [Paenibacillus spiritus]